jgi:hypothetical protein
MAGRAKVTMEQWPKQTRLKQILQHLADFENFRMIAGTE